MIYIHSNIQLGRHSDQISLPRTQSRTASQGKSREARRRVPTGDDEEANSAGVLRGAVGTLLHQFGKGLHAAIPTGTRP